MATQLDEHVEDLAFTGERFMPEVAQIAFEHLHRYHFAARFCAGKQVVDVACGEGYGSQILSGVADSVTGIDISAEAVAHAAGRYGSDRLRFVEASAALLPLEDDSVDVVVSFETIEHHDQHEEMLSEIRRVLRPGGMLIMSSPNKQHYSIDPGYENPYHVKELFRHELIELIQRYFRSSRCIRSASSTVPCWSLTVRRPSIQSWAPALKPVNGPKASAARSTTWWLRRMGCCLCSRPRSSN
jgi:ubiquinone/menaquinone biosynthesis C-methylase UbiE